MNYHAIIGTKRNMKGEKSTCLPCQTVDSLSRIIVLDFPRTASRLHDYLSKTNKIRNNTKKTKNRERYGDKGVVRIARIA